MSRHSVRFKFRIFAAACVLALAAAAPAAADTLTMVDPQITITQHLFDSLGNPRLVANPASGANFDRDQIRWSICPPPGDICSLAGLGAVLTSGPAEPGTVFEAAAPDGGPSVSTHSKPWLGRVTNLSVPSLTGVLTVGSEVKPIAGTWSGGWGNEYDDLHVEACRTATALHCETISAPSGGYPGSRGPALVGLRYAGWYLFAVDQRFARDALFTLPARLSPLDISPLHVGQTVVRSAPYGPVPRPAGFRVSVPKRIHRKENKITVAYVRCPHACSVAVAVGAVQRGNRWRSLAHFSNPPTQISHSGRIRVPVEFKGSAKLYVQVMIDGAMAKVAQPRLVN